MKVTNCTLVWIDDIRDPKNDQWQDFINKSFSEYNITNIIWVKSFTEFANYLEDNGVPEIVCFDHDLGDFHASNPEKERTGYHCALYLTEYCEDCGIDIPAFAIQSSNPVGREKISSVMNNYHKFYLKYGESSS